jgi:hypothetical protein
MTGHNRPRDIIVNEAIVTIWIKIIKTHDAGAFEINIIRPLFAALLCSASISAHAETVTLECDYQYRGPSLYDPDGEVRDLSARFKVDLDNGRVSGYQSTWPNGGNIKAIVDSSTIKILDVSADGAHTAVFAVSRIDGSVVGGAIGWKYEGKCAISSD